MRARAGAGCRRPLRRRSRDANSRCMAGGPAAGGVHMGRESHAATGKRPRRVSVLAKRGAARRERRARWGTASGHAHACTCAVGWCEERAWCMSGQAGLYGKAQWPSTTGALGGWPVCGYMQVVVRGRVRLAPPTAWTARQWSHRRPLVVCRVVCLSCGGLTGPGDAHPAVTVYFAACVSALGAGLLHTMHILPCM